MLITTSVIVATFVSIVSGTSVLTTGLKDRAQRNRVLDKQLERVNGSFEAIQSICESLITKKVSLDETREDLSAAQHGREHESGVVAELTEQKGRLQRANEATIEKRKRLDRLLRVRKKRNNEIVKGRDLIGFVNRLESAGYSCGLTTQGHGSHATLELDRHKSTIHSKKKNRQLLNDIQQALPDLLQNQDASDAAEMTDQIQRNWQELQKHRSRLAEINRDLDSLGISEDQLESEIEHLILELGINMWVVQEQQRGANLMLMTVLCEYFINSQSHGRPKIAWDVYNTLMDDLSFLGEDAEFRDGLKEQIEKLEREGRLGSGMSSTRQCHIGTHQELRILRCRDAMLERRFTQGLPKDIGFDLNIGAMFVSGLRSIEEASKVFSEESIQRLKNIPSDVITNTLDLMAEVESNYPSVDDETRSKRDSIYGVIPPDHPEYYAMVEREEWTSLHRIYQECGCEISIGESINCWAAINDYQKAGNEQAMLDLIEEAVRNERYFCPFTLIGKVSTPYEFGKYLISQFTRAAYDMRDSFDPSSEMLRKLNLGRKLLGNEARKHECNEAIIRLVGWHLNNDRHALALEEFVKVDSKSLRKQYRKEWTKEEIQAAEQEWHTRRNSIDAAQCRDHAHSLHQRIERVKEMSDYKPGILAGIQSDLERTEQMFIKAGLDRTHPGWMSLLSDEMIRVQELIQQKQPPKVKKPAKKKRGKK